MRQLETKRLAKGEYSLGGEVVLSNAMVKMEDGMEQRKRNREGMGQDGTGRDGK